VKRILVAAALLAATFTTADAFYTECTAQKEFTPANRPGGNADPRTPALEKGAKAAFRDSYGDWWFVVYSAYDEQHYGWVPRNILTRCQKMDGTP